MPTSRTLTLSQPGRRWLRRVMILAAVVGTALGVQTLALHMTTDPFADTRLYYDAGMRLNRGLPLYLEAVEGGPGPYSNPPLLAIMFRPLAMLPFPLAAAIWQSVVIGAFAVTLRRIGLREPVVIAIGCLALPICWALSIGQSEVVLTMLLTLGTPLSVAAAGHLKLLPWLVAVYWIGRRDRRSLLRLTVWIAVIGVAQLVLEPTGTLDFLRLTWLQGAFNYRSVSPFAIHPLLWVATVAVLAGLALRYGRTRYGWPLAVGLAVLTYPRLLVYQLMTLVAAFGGPRTGTNPDGTPVPVTGRTTRP